MNVQRVKSLVAGLAIAGAVYDEKDIFEAQYTIWVDSIYLYMMERGKSKQEFIYNLTYHIRSKSPIYPDSAYVGWLVYELASELYDTEDTHHEVS